LPEEIEELVQHILKLAEDVWFEHCWYEDACV
jgi:hypothetical protein